MAAYIDVTSGSETASGHRLLRDRCCAVPGGNARWGAPAAATRSGGGCPRFSRFDSSISCLYSSGSTCNTNLKD